MTLSITGATIGYDRTQVQAAINSLRQEAIEATKQKMASGLNTLNSEVDAVWVGTSADRFKKNMQTDYKTICDAMDESYDTLVKEIYQVVNEMDNIDQSVLAERKQ